MTPQQAPNPIEAAPLAALDNVRHRFFTREGGVSTGLYHTLNAGQGSRDETVNVAENRRRIADAMAVPPQHLVTVYQIHSPDCLAVTGPWPDDRPKADAMATATPGLALGILTADCAPVLFADPKAGVIGAAHAGWKGAVSGVLESTIAAMEGLGADRDNVTAAIGPTISQAAYEVGPEFVARFTDEAPDNAHYFSPSQRDGHAMFDLPGYIVARLKAAGVGQVHDTGLCTYGDEARFFSYRRATHRSEPDYGRLIATIALDT